MGGDPTTTLGHHGIAAFGHDLLLQTSEALEPVEVAPEARLSLRVHDRTRLEWIAAVPLAEGGERRAYDVQLRIDVPEHLWVKHPLWPAFRARSRLQTPDHAIRVTRSRSVVDDIRHMALRCSRRIKQLEHGILGSATPVPELEGLAETVARCRGRIRLAGDSDTPGVSTEASLADEYLSVALLSALARLHDAFAGDEAAVAWIAKAVRRERRVRRAAGWPTPRGKGRKGLDQWLQRRGALKKHFHQLLWLDADEYRPDDRLSNWIAGFVAILASTWAFAWHVAYMNQLVSGGMSMVSMVMAGAIAGVLYAIKDRIKDVGRRWLSRRVRDGIADKVVHLHLQERVDPRRARLLTSRERLRAERRRVRDPLNPALGETLNVVTLSSAMRIEQHGQEVPGEWGVAGVKHVMRYDLSALLPRLDPTTRAVPVTHADGRVRQAEVHKRYELQVRCELRDQEGRSLVRRGCLQIDHRGLRALQLSKPRAPGQPAGN